MMLSNRWHKRLREIFRRDAVENELDEEMATHLEFEIRQNIAAGMSPAEAFRQARIRFGGVEKAKEEVRERLWLGWAPALSLDLKLGLRMMRKHFGLTLIGGLGMAIATGIGAGIFAFSSTMMNPSLPLDEGERIVSIDAWDTSGGGWERQVLYDFTRWRTELQSIQDLTAFRDIRRNLIVGDALPEPIAIAEMSPAGFRVARVPPLMGRPLLDADERNGAARVIVIGYEEWKTRFAGDPGIVGRELRLGDAIHTVVGVMPEGFTFPVNHRYWIPFRPDPVSLQPRSGPELFVFGRLAPGVSRDAAQAELSSVGQRMSAELPQTHEFLRPRVETYTFSILDIQGAAAWHAWLIQIAASLLLVLVAANVSVLVYARTAMRQGEITVRTALGASRRRVVLQLFLEALVLAACSAMIGLAGVWLALRYAFSVMKEQIGGLPFWIQPRLPPSTYVYLVALVVLAGVIVGVVPALKATGSRLQTTLRQLGGGTGLQLGRTWTVLIVAQVAFAVIGMPVAYGIANESVSLGATTPTFSSDEYLLADLQLDAEPGLAGRAPGDPAYESRFQDRVGELVRRLEQEPGVTGVTYAASQPGRERNGQITVEGVTDSEDEPAVRSVAVNRVGADFFRVLGVPLQSGRNFESRDLEQIEVVVNATFANEIVPGGEAVGQQFRYLRTPPGVEPGAIDTTSTYQIVGVVADLHENRVDPSLVPPVIYHAAAPAAGRAALAIGTRGIDPGRFTGRLRQITAAVDPSLRYNRIQPFSELDRQQQTSVRLAALVVAGVAGSVLLLSAAGIYSLLSCVITRRRQELGIRAALGGTPLQILAPVLRHTAGQLGIGLAIGLGVTAVADVFTDGLLFNGRALLLLPVFAATMLVVAALGSIGPARRGLRIQPMAALREE